LHAAAQGCNSYNMDGRRRWDRRGAAEAVSLIPAPARLREAR